MAKQPFFKWRSRQYIEDAEYTVLDEKGEMLSASGGSLTAKTPAGRISGILLSVFGWIGLVLAAMGMLSVGAVALFFNGLVPVLTFPALLGIISAGMILSGSRKRRRVRLFYDYVRTFGSRGFAEIRALAAETGRSERYVRRQLARMIELDMFPEGRFNQDKTYVFLSEKIFREYTKMEAGRRLQEAEAEQAAATREKRQQKEAQDPVYRDVYQVIDQGERAVAELRDIRGALAGKALSDKIDRLIAVLEKIFDYLEDHPAALSASRKFLNYYLPTTLKLLTTYRQLDREPIQGPTITTTKEEIDNALDTINTAFENLLDSFYHDTSLDILSDIDVLETMLAQEGLTDQGHHTERETNG